MLFRLTAHTIIITRILSLIYFFYLRKITIFSSFATDSLHHYHVVLALPVFFVIATLSPAARRLTTFMCAVAAGIVIEEHIVIIYETIKNFGYNVPYRYLSTTDTVLVLLLAGVLYLLCTQTINFFLLFRQK